MPVSPPEITSSTDLNLLLKLVAMAFDSFESGNRERTEPVFWHALQVLPGNTRESARCLRYLSEINEERCQFSEAIDFQLRLVLMLKRSLGEYDQTFVTEIDALSSLYKHSGRMLEAAFLKAKSLILSQRLDAGQTDERHGSSALDEDPEWLVTAFKKVELPLLNPFTVKESPAEITHDRTEFKARLLALVKIENNSKSGSKTENDLAACIAKLIAEDICLTVTPSDQHFELQAQKNSFDSSFSTAKGECATPDLSLIGLGSNSTGEFVKAPHLMTARSQGNFENAKETKNALREERFDKLESVWDVSVMAKLQNSSARSDARTQTSPFVCAPASPVGEQNETQEFEIREVVWHVGLALSGKFEERHCPRRTEAGISQSDSRPFNAPSQPFGRITDLEPRKNYAALALLPKSNSQEFSQRLVAGVSDLSDRSSAPITSPSLVAKGNSVQRSEALDLSVKPILRTKMLNEKARSMPLFYQVRFEASEMQSTLGRLKEFFKRRPRPKKRAKETFHLNLKPLSVISLMAVCLQILVPHKVSPVETYNHMAHRFRSANGQTSLDLESVQRCELKVDKESSVLNYRILDDNPREYLGILMTAPFETRLWARETAKGLQLSNGEILYPSESGEAKLTKRLDHITDEAANYYLQNHTYPAQKAGDIDFRYRNPYSGQLSEPEFLSINLTAEKHSQGQSPTYERLCQKLKNNEPFDGEKKPLPGDIHCISVRISSAKGTSSAFFVRAYDEKANCIKSAVDQWFFESLADGKLTGENSLKAVEQNQSTRPVVCLSIGDGLFSKWIERIR